MAKSILIDARNYESMLPQLIEAVQKATVVGIDTETHNQNAHDGLKEFRKNKEGRAFDYRRMVCTGLSIYPELNATEETAYYFNLNHKDEENRLTWEQVSVVLNSKPANVSWVAHNAVYELVVLKSCYDFDLPNIIDTLQMAVSAWGPDEYDHADYLKMQFGGMTELFADAERLFRDYDKKEGRDNQTPQQGELLAKVLGKSSVASFSYNGIINEIAYSYGLKKLVKKFFNHQMQTFDETLESGNEGEGVKHMGELTGDEVAEYGSEDAYWAVKLFYKIYEYMTKNCPEAIDTFFTQENPMIHVFANIRLQGICVNKKAIEDRRAIERANFATTIRKLKEEGRKLLPFAPELNEKLAKYDKWYREKGSIYRDRLGNWLMSSSPADDLEMCKQVSSPVTNAWIGKKSDGISIGHYYQSRLLMYDLTQSTPITSKGKVESDAEARGTMIERFDKRIKNSKADGDDEAVTQRLETCKTMLKYMGELASIEQRMKLYLNPYLLLTDPETNRMYPEVSSMLATRRMACSNPNAMQLAKRGESTYVRGFYVPDSEDEVYVSLDWSQVELVIIGDESGDPEFAKAYGQLPYQDLHLGAAADVLGVVIEGVSSDLLKNMHKIEVEKIPPALLVKPNGEPLTPDKAKKYWRTEVGKGSNFNYWYSGALSTVGDKLGWTPDQMWKATEAYRQRFSVAEAWRIKIIEDAKWSGQVMLRDGHRRTRFEATHEWLTLTHNMFDMYKQNGLEGVYKFGQEVMRAVRTRAGNQLVNAKVQGTSATLAKRSIVSIQKACNEHGIRATFKMPIHDELLFSVHKEDVLKFIKLAKSIMTNHPDIIKTLKLDCTASVGLTFEPFHPKSAPIGQIELDEAPAILDFEDGSKLNDEQIAKVVTYLFEKRSEMRKAA